MNTNEQDGSPPSVYGDVAEELLRSVTDAYNRALTAGLDFDALLGNALEEALTAGGRHLAKELQRRAPKMLREHRRMRRAFERRLGRNFRRALGLFYQVYVASQEFGSDFNRVHRPGAAKESDFKFEALTGIHGRACLVASEVHALLRTGHPLGALARWRTLHELAVVACILGEGDQTLAERYLLHALVESHKDAQHFAVAQPHLNEEPLDPEEVEELARTREELIARFGKTFGYEWGWAAEIVANPQHVTFKELETIAGIAHMRPYYRWSSHNVHAGSKGSHLNQVDFYGSPTILTGPTNRGLTDPGHSTLISLVLITCTLATKGRPEAVELMTVPILVALLKMTDEAGQAFLEAEESVERRARKLGQVVD